MYIESGGEKIPVLGAYEDERYANGIPIPAVHIQAAAFFDPSKLLGKSIVLKDDKGGVLHSFLPCNTVAICEVVITRTTDLDAELGAVKAERDALAVEVAALRKTVEAKKGNEAADARVQAASGKEVL